MFEQENQEHQELQNFQNEAEGRRGGKFIPGFFIGMLSTVFLCGAVLLIVTQTTGSKFELVRQTVPGEKEAAATVLSSDTIKKINELTGYINLYYYETPEADKLEDGLYSGLLQGLGDPYSAYYNIQDYENLQISATQNYYGIGAGLSQNKDSMQVTVSHVYEGSPAEAAGLKKGDIIIKVEDIDSTTMDLADLVTHIRGEEGSKVHLQLYREGESEYLEYDVERANIDLPTVEYKLLEGQAGYIHILEFGSGTAKQFEEAVADLKSQGMKSMILDVRDNPGGMITAVNQILDDILPEGTMVYVQDKYGERQDFTSSGDTSMDYPIAVLMNGNSASASEILAGAIRDFEYGTLIGSKSFGKGIVQTIYPLEEGDALKLTTAKYYTPKGENIHGKGIEPDVAVEYEYLGDKTADTYDEMQDNQILKALEILGKE